MGITILKIFIWGGISSNIRSEITFYGSAYAMYNFLVEKYIFTILDNERYKVKMKNCKLYQKYIMY